MRQLIPSAAAQSRGVLAAVVLGTALTATGTAAESRPAPTTEVSGEEIRDVTRYCQVCWRNARLPADAWADCTQQVLTRLLQTVPADQWALMLQADGVEKREFLRAIDAVKKRTQRTRKPGELTADVADARQRPTVAAREQWEAVNVAADRVLSERQKRIVELSANGWAVPDIAAELGTTTERVSDEKYKAIRKLRVQLGVDAA
jgi:DNA-directed RNA polymerase specialized sigma subunit